MPVGSSEVSAVLTAMVVLRSATSHPDASVGSGNRGRWLELSFAFLIRVVDVSAADRRVVESGNDHEVVGVRHAPL